MATDDSGKTTTSSYAPGDAIYVFADLNGLYAGSILEARWYAVDNNRLPANSRLSSADYGYESGISYMYFELTTTDGSDWPIGSYRVQVLLDRTKVGEQGFTVE